MLQPLVHYSLHFLLPIIIALVFFRHRWKSVALLLLAAIIIDLDHLFATPIFDPNRCSVGFHPLHNYVAIGVYLALLFFKNARIVALGLLLHIAADLVDCMWMN
ncbi:MAG: DUF6122 family protein [Bacteroidota bacterium]